MKKNIIIIGAGPGASLGVAKKFGNEGYTVGLISRNTENLSKLSDILTAEGIENYSATADVGDPLQLKDAIDQLRNQLKTVDVLVYNTAVLKVKDILQESADSLTEDFKVNVAAALQSLQALHEDLKVSSGAMILTGGFFSDSPNVDFGSLSIGKAGLKNLAIQLNEKLAADNIYAGIITIHGYINADSETHNPTVIAEKYYKAVTERNKVEIVI